MFMWSAIREYDMNGLYMYVSCVCFLHDLCILSYSAIFSCCFTISLVIIFVNENCIHIKSDVAGGIV